MFLVTGLKILGRVGTHILEDFENALPYFALFLQAVYAIEKLGLMCNPELVGISR